MEVLVGILSTLVTVLIGWQIYNVIAFEKQVDQKIKKRLNEFTEQYKKDQDIRTKEINSSRRLTLSHLLYLVATEALALRDPDIICHCLNEYFEDASEDDDIEAAMIASRMLRDVVDKKHELPPFNPNLLSDLELPVRRLCRINDIGFECLELLEQLREGAETVK